MRRLREFLDRFGFDYEFLSIDGRICQRARSTRR